MDLLTSSMKKVFAEVLIRIQTFCEQLKALNNVFTFSVSFLFNGGLWLEAMSHYVEHFNELKTV